jgi:histone arginine demethylase JMJD6
MIFVLQGIYEEGSRSLEHAGEDCLFFPYATEFRSLAEVFSMTQERHGMPWYIGW